MIQRYFRHLPATPRTTQTPTSVFIKIIAPVSKLQIIGNKKGENVFYTLLYRSLVRLESSDIRTYTHTEMYDIYVTVHLEAGLSTREPVINSKAVYVGFVVDYVIPRQDTLSVSPVSIIPPILRAHFSWIYHRRHLIVSNEQRRYK